MGNEASTQAARAEEIALVTAVRSGDLAAIQALLRQKPQLIYAHSKSGENIWHFAAAAGHAQVLQAVNAAVEGVLSGQKKQDRLKAQVTHGFNQVNQAMNQVISSAVPLPSAIAIPMQRDISIDAQTREGLTPLMSAVKAGQPAACEMLLGLGADAWRGDNSGCTALHHAAWQGQLACVGLLLQHADIREATPGEEGLLRLVDTTTNTGLTPLQYAAWRGHCSVLKQLVNAGALLAAPSSSDTMGAVAANAGSTPLHLAAMKGEVAAVRLLLKANARLMRLVAEQPAAAAEATAASGALGDIRSAADKYGKTACRLAWDMHRSDLGVILDPATPLEQAIQLAEAAAAAAGATKPSFSSKNLLQGQQQQQQQQQGQQQQSRQPGAASVEPAPGGTPAVGPPGQGNSSDSKAQPAAAASTSGGNSYDVAAAVQRLGLMLGLGLGVGGSGSRTGSTGARAPLGRGATAGSSAASSRPAAATATAAEDSSDQREGGRIVLTRVRPAFATARAAAAAEAGALQDEDEFGGFLAAEGAAAGSAGSNGNDGDSSSSWAVFQAVGGERGLPQPDSRSSSPAAAPAVAVAAVGAAGDEPPAAWLCPITNELLREPVRASDGLAYEREAIEVWFQLGNSLFPGGRHRITSTALQPDGALRRAIADWTAGRAADKAHAGAAAAVQDVRS